MTFQPTLDLHPENEFHFANNTDSRGCCCFWESKSKPKEYYVNENGTLEPFKSSTEAVNARIRANKRLAKLVSSKFDNDPIDNNEAFERLRRRVNHDFDNGEKITEEKLIAIVNAMYQIKREASSQEELDAFKEGEIQKNN